MSGHSKWAQIKHKKGIADAKKGKVFSQHAKLIAMAARHGSDPDMNASLRLAIDNAKKDNLPNDNIQRAIKKGSGEDKSVIIEEVTYEAYGPGGVALMIECLTDNKNRTHSNIHTLLDKKGGNLASGGSVAWMFEKKGVIEGGKTKSDDELEMMAIEAGADDIKIEEDFVIVYTKVENFMNVKSALEKQGFQVDKASLKQVPKDLMKIGSKETADKLINLIDALDDDDDVSEVYGNFEIPDELL
ncbi:MAG: hypothetical protein UR28_C0030G0009 [Candidatus Peregrinibacteria bacterium GW2011_GWF2_33_10]|nr:MAG: hypothetical protein UR28_C0030G0009 [Candidatus Peregrinibacteria bacterium GW2011_GWF2_33_10]OGJ45134.1 MAG: transcriptional regulator [Candidatus Peregrinibacteria bacterium RIFOXYA2_FULL_33_21]OGJ46504.1 MAG: transcriptional regulator [Candidatus Peregrinibacteria bacterium RIFOXYA12_FULL_33_12]OGJ50803.1 MAG: transcriptional regulator [Candidatus Peregrinibacteria bacterium RIFOXYB2_FULL_33_20]